MLRPPPESPCVATLRSRALYRCNTRNWRPRGAVWRRLEEDLGGCRGRAALLDELDGPVQVGLAVRDLLGERERVPGLDQHVQAPALDFRALRLFWFGDLAHGDCSFVLW